MSRTVAVGELRQNLTRALNEVRDGATVVVMRHNRPIADLVPHSAPPGIGGAELDARLRGLDIDEDLRADLAAARAAVEQDLWA